MLNMIRVDVFEGVVTDYPVVGLAVVPYCFAFHYVNCYLVIFDSKLDPSEGDTAFHDQSNETQ